MAKKKRNIPTPQASADKPATLKDLLSSDVLNKLKAQANELQAAEEQRKEDARKQVEAERLAEQKLRDNDFAYLLENSKHWNKYT